MANKEDWYNTIRGQFGRDTSRTPEVVAEDRGKAIDFLGSLISTAPAGTVARMLGWDIPRRDMTPEEVLLGAAFSSMGMVKMGGGAAKKLALRKLMQKEMKGRGKVKDVDALSMDKYLATEGTLRQMYRQKAISGTDFNAACGRLRAKLSGKETFLGNNPWFTDVLRGSWFRGHGSGKYPTAGEEFASDLITGGPGGKLGEPFGVSLSADAERIRGGFAGKDPKIDAVWNKLKSKRLKLFEELRASDPTFADWTASKVQSFMENYLPDLNYLSPIKKNLSKIKNIDQLTKKMSSVSEKNRVEGRPLARVLPRFGKAPEEVVLPAWKAPETEWAQEILRDAYKEAAKKVYWDRDSFKRGTMSDQDILYAMESSADRATFNEALSEILQKKGYKGLLYSQGRYNEAELRMLKPEDVLMLDLRGQKDKALERMFNRSIVPGSRVGTVEGKAATRLFDWEDATRTSQAKLGAIYEDIDLVKLFEKPGYARARMPSRETVIKMLEKENLKSFQELMNLYPEAKASDLLGMLKKPEDMLNKFLK